jgi:predicted small secreted protein
MFRTIILALVLIALIAVLVGCNTVQGLGKDIEWTGQKGAEVLSGE